MRNRVTIKTRSSNPELYKKMASLIPEGIDASRFDNYRDWQDASRFIHDAISWTKGILILIDDDCFVYDWDSVDNLVSQVINDGYAFCGMSDYGAVHHRSNSKVVANPFFLIVNCDLVNKEKRKYSRRTIDKMGEGGAVPSKKKEFEIFNGIFYFMAWKFKAMYLDAITLEDGISTSLLYNGNPFLIHTWYSRNYGVDGETKKRIDDAFEMAKSKVNEQR